MARLPYVTKQQLSTDMQILLREASESHVTRVLSNSPRLAHLAGTVAKYIRENRAIDPRLRELALIQVGYAINCPYVYAHHIKVGYSFGVTEADVRSVAEETAGRPSTLEPFAKTILSAVRDMCAGRAIADATFSKLRENLNNEQLIELIYAAGNYLGAGMVLKSVQIELEPDMQHFIQQFPIATA